MFEGNPQQSGFWTLKKLAGGVLHIKKGRSSTGGGGRTNHEFDDEDDDEDSGGTYGSRPKSKRSSFGSPRIGRKRTFSEIDLDTALDDLPVFVPGSGTPKRSKTEIPAHDGPQVPFRLRRKNPTPPYARCRCFFVSRASDDVFWPFLNCRYTYQLVGGMLREIGWNLLRRPKPVPLAALSSSSTPAVVVAASTPVGALSSSAPVSASHSIAGAALLGLSAAPSMQAITPDDDYDNDTNGIDEDHDRVEIDLAPSVVAYSDPYAPETYFDEDEYGIPLPPGWYDRTMKRYPVAAQIARATARMKAGAERASPSKKAGEEEIPLPSWREALPTAGSRDGKADEEDEDCSDAKYEGLHSYYESLERRIKKYN